MRNVRFRTLIPSTNAAGISIRACKRWEANGTALLKRADGTWLESVDFPTVEKCANIGPRRRQQLMEQIARDADRTLGVAH